MADQRLSVQIYQLAEDALFRDHRTDGSGWDWGWADFQRDWMNATPSRHAYRCLPLTIANQTGWWIRNPVGFTATWGGSMAPGDMTFAFDSPDPIWPAYVNSQFGEGIITWNTPFLFRTEPTGSRLLITGPANYFRKDAHPLTAIIESDWMVMSFTMNYKLMAPGTPIRFETGEPLFQAIPLMNNLCADLERAEVRYQKLTDDPATYQAYTEWSTARTKFHEAKSNREVKPDQWQKDYFQGRGASDRQAVAEHRTKVKPPEILIGPAGRANDPAKLTQELGAGGSREVDGATNDRSRRETRVASPPAPAGAKPGSPPTSARASTSKRLDLTVGACPFRPDETLKLSAGRPNGSASGLQREAPHAESTSEGQGGTMDSPAATLRSTSLSEGTPDNLGRGAAEHQDDRPAPAPTRINDDWRSWIAENLLLDSAPARIRESMVSAGIDPVEADREIAAALASPYIRGANHLRNRLKKRDWLLGTYRRIHRLSPESDIIPRRHRLSRGQFLNEYYSTNRPVILTGMMDDWPALRKWDLDFFEHHFGDRPIEVQFGRNADSNYEIEREKYIKTITMAEFVGLIRSAGATNDFYLTANNTSKNKQVLPELWNDIVQIPEYLDGRDRMSGFFWMGPAGTITPFHHDLTNNFMAQVIGRKKVKIAPSWDLPLMLNDFHVFSRVDGRLTRPQPNPTLDQPQIIECILSPGEILFLPIGCLHYVEGLDVSVTISFTNFAFPNDFASSYTTYHDV